MNREIVIVGCGFGGMLTALSFANNNIKTTILEYQSIISDNFCNDIRTTALTPASAQFFSKINIWAEVENIASKMLNVYVVDNKAQEMLHFADIKGNNPLGYIVKNSEFKKILLEKVKNNPLIEIIDQFDYQKIDSNQDHSIIHFANNKIINGNLLICNLLIVCDGRDSKVRQYYFFNKINKSYKQTALTFNIKHDKDHENCAIEHFMPSGPFAILPLKDPKSSSVIWTVNQEQVPLLLNLPNDEFEYLVNKHAGNSLGNISVDSRISTFPLKAQIANKYFHNKIVVVADTAHIVHPLAGQGLNQGIKDIVVLTELISSASISEELLKQYQKLRQKDNLVMYSITDKLNSIFSNDCKSLWYLRRLGLKIIDNIEPIKQLLLQYAMGRR